MARAPRPSARRPGTPTVRTPGTSTCTGSAPTTVRPPASFWKRSTSACSPPAAPCVARRLQAATASGAARGLRAAPRRTGPDRARPGTRPAAARRESAASSAARRRCARPADRAPAARGARALVRPRVDRAAGRPARRRRSAPPRRRALFERQQHGLRLRRRRAGSGGRPTSALHTVEPARQRHLEEAALVVADRVARLDEQPAVLRRERAIARLLDVGDEHRLRRVADDGDGERSRLAAGERPEPERDHRRRLAAGDDVAELRRIGRLEAARLALADLAGADDVDGDAAGLALGRRHAHERHGDRALARRARFAPARRTTTSVAIGSSSRTRSRPPLTSQSATVGAVHLVDDEPRGKRERDVAREPLHDFDAHGGGYLAARPRRARPAA